MPYSVRLSDAMRAELEEIADDEDRSIAYIIKQAIREYLANQAALPDIGRDESEDTDG